MVGLALLRTVPATRAAAGPSGASSSAAVPGAPGGSCAPTAAAMASTAALTVGISRTGQS